MEEAPIELDRSNRYTMKRVPRIRYAYRSTTLDTSLPYIYTLYILYILTHKLHVEIFRCACVFTFITAIDFITN